MHFRIQEPMENKGEGHLMTRLPCCHRKNNKMDCAEDQEWPRKEEAREYLKEHKILELFDNLTAQLIYARPGTLS